MDAFSESVHGVFSIYNVLLMNVSGDIIHS